jgi:hypothetical protein
MRVQLFRFSGFLSGQTNFELSASLPGNPTSELGDALQVIASGITGSADVRTSITIVGHSDRQDRSDLTCDQRRESEIAGARDRANSAWEWCKQGITEFMAGTSGIPADWWESSDSLTWDLVYAAAGHAVDRIGH